MSGSTVKQQALGVENRWNIDECSRTGYGEDSRLGSRPFLQYNHDKPINSSRIDMNVLQHGYLDCSGCSTINLPSAPYSLQPQPAFQVFTVHPLNNVLHQEMMNYNCKSSPTLSRGPGTIMGASAYQHKSNGLETLSVNIDELVMKIGATFPTVSDTHIRCLLKKYHNREAVVMSALQVEKHPIATPGPHSTSILVKNSSIADNSTPFQMTPPISMRGTPSASIRKNMITPSMLMYGSIGTPPLGVWGTPPTRGSSPVLRPGSCSSYYSSSAFGDYKQSPKSQSSPKMKLRYLKSVFPKVDETLLLDTLISENNNVMKTAEKLKLMGFEKKEVIKASEKKAQNEICISRGEKSVFQKEVEIQKPTPPPRLKSLEEKNRMRARLAGLYDQIPERLIQIAIESVNYDEEKARHLLMLMINEEKENKLDLVDEKNESPISSNKLDQERQDTALKKLLKDDDKKKQINEKKPKSRKDVVKVSRGTSTTEDKEFKSIYMTKVSGRNRDLRKGPNDQLLLTDYMTWHGPNPELKSGANKSLPQGPKKNLSGNRTVVLGPKKENWKGPILGLAKGSIYSHITMILKE